MKAFYAYLYKDFIIFFKYRLYIYYFWYLAIYFTNNELLFSEVFVFNKNYGFIFHIIEKARSDFVLSKSY